VAENGEAVQGTVSDDGHGFELDGDAAGFGLLGMRERAAFTGGTLAVASGADGTRVTFSLPARRSVAEVAG
jgi:two-component system sensor histidine kinase UhpB